MPCCPLEVIQHIVANYYDLCRADMTRKRRPYSSTFSWQVALFFCRKMTAQSFPSIAHDFRRNLATASTSAPPSATK